MEDGQLRGLVCASDSMIREAAAAAVTAAEYDLVAETSSVADTLEMLKLISTDLIVIDNDLPRALAIEWLSDLHESAPLAAILLIANDEAILDRAMRDGAFGVVYKKELSELSGALQRARAWLNDPDLRKPGERRTGSDRRRKQDWGKVTSERRSGEDRRGPDDSESDSDRDRESGPG